MAVKRIVAPRQAPVLALAAPTHASAPGKKAITPRPASSWRGLPPSSSRQGNAGTRGRDSRAGRTSIEVRNSFPQVSGPRQLVIYVRAKVVSASVGTDSYLVQYPAAGSIPSRTARVPAWDVRAARRVPAPPESAVDAARPASSKRPRPSDRSETESGADGSKKVKSTGKGIPMDALRRFFQEHEEEEKRKKARKHNGELLAPKLRPETETIKKMIVDRACPASVSLS